MWLQRRNAHPNNNTSWTLLAISIDSFHAAPQRMHDAVMAEFSDLHTDVPVESKTSPESRAPMDPDIPAVATEDNIASVGILSQPQDVDTTVEAMSLKSHSSSCPD
jgi:hypothetical protein